MNTTDKKKIDFWPSQTVILVEYPTGIIYEAQTGGIACHHPSAEGYIEFTEIDYEKKLYKLENYYGGITKQEADMVDEVLKEDFMCNGWKVDRTRLGEGEEAWIPLKRGKEKGYLCWENSD